MKAGFASERLENGLLGSEFLCEKIVRILLDVPIPLWNRLFRVRLCVANQNNIKDLEKKSNSIVDFLWAIAFAINNAIPPALGASRFSLIWM